MVLTHVFNYAFFVVVIVAVFVVVIVVVLNGCFFLILDYAVHNILLNFVFLLDFDKNEKRTTMTNWFSLIAV